MDREPKRGLVKVLAIDELPNICPIVDVWHKGQNLGKSYGNSGTQMCVITQICIEKMGLAMNGVNPFGLHSTKWSMWPVVLVNYNIPPWLSIKKGHLLLSLIIPDKRKVKNISVYLAPLIDEL